MVEHYEQSARVGVVAKLEFPLPECQAEFELAVHGPDWKIAMEDLDGWLRNLLKYDLENMDGPTLEKVRTKLHEVLQERNLVLHE